MAEIEVAAAGKKPGGRRSKKLSTKVDLTPMVDLGFLLITFFVFTTTMADPVAVKLTMPKDSTDSTKVPMSTALTAFLTNDGKIFYYHGDLRDAMKSGQYGTTTYSYADGIGEVIRTKQKTLGQRARELFLVIKPAEQSNYNQLINIMDEVIINRLEHYAISDITEGEKTFITKVRGSF